MHFIGVSGLRVLPLLINDDDDDDDYTTMTIMMILFATCTNSLQRNMNNSTTEGQATRKAMCEKNIDIIVQKLIQTTGSPTVICFDSIPACDRRTDTPSVRPSVARWY